MIGYAYRQEIHLCCSIRIVFEVRSEGLALMLSNLPPCDALSDDSSKIPYLPSILLPMTPSPSDSCPYWMFIEG